MPRACRRKLDALKYPILSVLRKRTDSCKLPCERFQQSCCHQQLSCCLFQFRARMSRALNKFCCAGRIQAPVLLQCLLVSCWKNKHLCQLMGRLCINPVHIDHQYQRDGRHAGSTVSMFPNGSKPQINEECLLRTVESRESLSLADTSDLCVGCVGKSFSC